MSQADLSIESTSLEITNYSSGIDSIRHNMTYLTYTAHKSHDLVSFYVLINNPNTDVDTLKYHYNDRI